MTELLNTRDIVISSVELITPFGTRELIEESDLLFIAIYEDMFEENISARLLVRDVTGWADEILLNAGNTQCTMRLVTPEGDDIELPEFYAYGVNNEEMKEFTAGRKYVLDLVSKDAISAEHSIDHLSITDEDDEEKLRESWTPRFAYGR